MSRKKFEQYVESGPDSLGSAEEVIEVLNWKDAPENREEAAHIQRVHDIKMRQLEEKETARAFYEVEHGGAEGFEAAWKAQTEERRRDTLSELQRRRDEEFLRLRREF